MYTKRENFSGQVFIGEKHWIESGHGSISSKATHFSLAVSVNMDDLSAVERDKRADLAAAE